MSLAHADLPADPEALRAFALTCQAELKAAEASVQLRTLEIEKLRLQIAKLRRMQFGRSSERVSRQIEQLELQLEELETDEAVRVEEAGRQPVDRQPSRPKRQPLPGHLPRQEIVHLPEGEEACVCPDCGGGMARLGEDITEVLDYVPGRFQVIRHVRPKYACKACDTITQAPAPALPTPRGRATPAMLAHFLLVSKYCDHLPLYRQSEIYAREGMELDRSTLCDWVGQAAWLLVLDRDLREFARPGEIIDELRKAERPRHAVLLQLWAPATSEKLEIQRFSVSVEGHTHRHRIAGWGLMQLYLSKQTQKEIPRRTLATLVGKLPRNGQRTRSHRPLAPGRRQTGTGRCFSESQDESSTASEAVFPR